MSICGGVAGRRGKNPVGFVIHNDAGSQNANANFYNTWLRTHNLASGFAHYYVGSDYTLQAEDDYNMAWHCGDTDGNVNYLSVEACQSLGDKKVFLKNEENALKLVAQKFKQYGITPGRSTVKLHCQFSATGCPHRSMELHGGAQATQDYFIEKVSEYMGENVSVGVQTGLTAAQAENLMEGEEMEATFTIDGGATVYYVLGSEIKPLTHSDELKAINDIYKLAHGGKSIPCIAYKSDAPYYHRLLDVLRRAPVTKYGQFHK